MKTANKYRDKYLSNYPSSTCLGCFFGGWLAACFAAVSSASDNTGAIKMMTFESTITIVLSALSVMLTILTIIIAVVGFFGYTQLRDAAFDAGLRHATEQMEEGGELRQIVLMRTDQVIAERSLRRMPEEEWGDPNKEYGA